jgi:hypothetical protein
MINLYLDDKRSPDMTHNQGIGLGVAYSSDDKWLIVRDYFEFVDIINNNYDDIQLISFDHDLACFDDNNREYTGKDAVDYLINYCLNNDRELPDWYVHTDNPRGKMNIIGSFLSYLKIAKNFNVDKFRYYHKGIINNQII